MNDEEVGKIVAGLFILFFGLAIGLIVFTTFILPVM